VATVAVTGWKLPVVAAIVRRDRQERNVGIDVAARRESEGQAAVGLTRLGLIAVVVGNSTVRIARNGIRAERLIHDAISQPRTGRRIRLGRRVVYIRLPEVL